MLLFRSKVTLDSYYLILLEGTLGKKKEKGLGLEWHGLPGPKQQSEEVPAINEVWRHLHSLQITSPACEGGRGLSLNLLRSFLSSTRHAHCSLQCLTLSWI